MVSAGLVAAIRENRLITVCGAGITASTVPSSQFGSWLRLIEHGINTVLEHDARQKEWAELTKRQLEIAEDPNEYVHAAQSVANKLGARHFHRWIQDTIGTLQEPEASDLVESIALLGMPIATTNYDTLIERVTNRDGVHWKNPDNMQRALAGKLSAVVHLHGIYLEPETVIFGSQSYGGIIGDEGAQAVQWLMAGGKSMLFVGASGTLEDPNLGLLLAKIDHAIPNSTNEHYLVCRESERNNLLDKYKDSPITIVSFGSDDYAELPEFIRSIAVAAGKSLEGNTRTNYNAAAHSSLILRVQDESIVTIEQRDPGNNVSDLLVAPVLLAAPHEDIISSFSDYKPGEENKEIRTDPYRDAFEHKTLVLIGEEISGVTSALEWLVLTNAEQDTTAVPVLVDYHDLTSGTRGLDRLIRQNLADSCAVPPGESLKNIVLAVDNVVPNSGRKFKRLIDDLNSEWVRTCFLGCAPGGEADLKAALKARGLNPTMRYMGRMTRRDVHKLVRLAVDTEDRASSLAAKVHQTLGTEGLPITAWNVTLLLDIFLHTTLTIQSISSSTLLDQFISSLLGRELHEDSRVSIDARDREAILAALAGLFCRQKTGSLPEGDVIQFLSELFEQYGWDESPTAMLQSFKARHILSTRFSDPKDRIRFAQPSYLYLFAAKQAKEDSDFKEHLLNDPNLYSKIITHYTSLVRNDGWVLEQIRRLVDQHSFIDGQATIFAKVTSEITAKPFGFSESNNDGEANNSSDGSRSHDQTADRNDSADNHDHADDNKDDGDDHDDHDDDFDYMLEHAMTGASDPFPTRDESGAPQLQQSLTALSLVSNVLRDSELVKNMPLKIETLKITMRMWAEMVLRFETDKVFTDMGGQIAEELGDIFELPGVTKDEFIEHTKFNLPLYFSITSMISSTASKKLEVAIQSCFEDLIGVETGAAIMTALLASEVGTKTWPSNFVEVGKLHAGLPVVFDLMFKLAYHHYIFDKVTAEQRAEIEAFIRLVLVGDKFDANQTVVKLRARRVRQQAATKAKAE